MPVRLGVPQHVVGLVDVVRNPIYATGVGLLLYGNQHGGGKKVRASEWNGKGLFARMKSWFQGNF